MPFIFINGLIFMVIAYYLHPPLRELLNSEQVPKLSITLNLFSIVYVAIILVFMTIHEFVHAALFNKCSRFMC